MESEPAHMVEDKNELQEKLKSKLMGSTVLDSFTKLTSDKENIRIGAGITLLKHLNSVENTNKEENECTYALDRLVRGVGSSRTSTKVGFYSVLVALLSKSSLITVENVFNTIKKHLSTGGSNSKGENADICMGQIFVCGALIHSNMFTKATVEEQKNIIEMLITAGKKRSYLSLASYTFLVELLEKVDEQQFKTVWSCLKDEVLKSLNEQTLDSVYFLIMCRRKFPTVVKSKTLKKILEVNEVVHEESVPTLCNILLNIPMLATLKHPVYTVIGKEIVEKQLVKEWCTEMDNQLQKLNRNKQLIITTLLTSFLENLVDFSVISDMLTNQYIKSIVQTFKHVRSKDKDDEFLNKMNNFFKILTKQLQNENVTTETKITVVKKLIFYPGIFIFEKITRTKIIQQITMSLDTDGVKQLSILYKDVVIAKQKKMINESDSENWINSDRIYAAQLLVKLLGHSSVQKEHQWRLEQLKFLLRLGLFKDIDEESSVSVELAASLKDSFYHALDQRLPKLEDLRNILSSLIHFINDNVFEKSKYQLRTPLTDDGVKCWSEMMQLVVKLEEGKNKFKHSYAIPVFHTLLLHMALQLFSDIEMAQNTLKELHSCFSRLEKGTPKKRKLTEGQLEENEPVWIEVVVDLFLSLLSQNSHLLRSVIGCVFPYLCPHLTLTAVRQILDVLDPKNEQNPLLKQEESDEDDDDDDDDKDSDSNDESDDDSDDDKEDAASSEDSGLEEENLDDEQESATDKLRMAVRDALHKSGYQTDDESEDMDEMDEEEGQKLDKALAEAFKMVKKSKGKKNKQTKSDKTLTHFRVRVLDLIDIYLDSEPNMNQCLEITCLLLQTLEFSIRDVHQKPLENRIRSCLKKISAMKKFSSTDEITEEILVNMLNSFLDKGSKSAFIYQDMGDIIAECCMFVVRCSQILNSANASETPSKKSKKYKSKIADIFKISLETFFKKRDCLLPLPLFKSVLHLNWEGNWCLVPLLIDFAFKDEIRPFRRSQALELLNIFYSNNRFRTTNPEVFKKRISPLETDLSAKTIDLLQSLAVNPKECKIREKFVCHLLNLLSSVKEANGSENVDWKTIGEAVREYRSHVSLATDTKAAYTKLCRTLGIPNVVKMKLINNDVNGQNQNGKESSDSETENDDQEKKHKEKKRKKVKSQKKDVQKMKKEARLLRMKAGSEGLTNDFVFSNVSLTDIKNNVVDDLADSEEDQQPKKKKNKHQANGISNHVEESDNKIIGKSKKKNKSQLNGMVNGESEPEENISKKIKKKKTKNVSEDTNNIYDDSRKRYSSESDDRPTKKKVKK